MSTNTITVAAALAFIARLVELGWITTPPADMGAEEPDDAEVIARTLIAINDRMTGGDRKGRQFIAPTAMLWIADEVAAALAAAARVRPAGEDVREADVIHLSDPEAGYSYCLEPVTLIEAEGDDRPICQTCHRGAMKSVRSGWCPCVTGRPQDCSPEKWPLSRRHGIAHVATGKAQP